MNSELARRVAFTLGALLLYRLGTFIPIPGLDRAVWARLFADKGNGVLGAANVASGGAIERLSIFALGIAPYVGAAILLQIAATVLPRLNAVSRGGEAGRQRMRRGTLALALVLAGLQAAGIASGLQRIDGAVTGPGLTFMVSTVATLLAGTAFLVWLSEWITARGIGNGLALILATGLVCELPRSLASIAGLALQGALPAERIALLGILTVAIVALVVMLERARRRIPVAFAARRLGDRAIPPQSAHLSLKINSAGLIPAVVAPWLLFLPLTFAGLLFGYSASWLQAAARTLAPGQPGNMALMAVAIIILAVVYTSFVVDPEYAANSLRLRGGTIPGVAPGEPTADHLDRIVSVIAIVGAAYLALVFLIPDALIAYAKVPYYFGGASALIVVCTVLDIDTQVRALARAERGSASS